jgi:hypothetical protein
VPASKSARIPNKYNGIGASPAETLRCITTVGHVATRASDLWLFNFISISWIHCTGEMQRCVAGTAKEIRYSGGISED